MYVHLGHALQYFLKTGTCKYGSTCKYHHPRDRRGAGPVSFNVVGLPMRQVLSFVIVVLFTDSFAINAKKYATNLPFSLFLLRTYCSDHFSGRKTMFLLHANWIVQVWSCLQVPSPAACITWNCFTSNWACWCWIYGLNSYAFIRSTLCRWTSCMVITKSAIYIWPAFSRSGNLHARFSSSRHCTCPGLEHVHGRYIIS